MKVSGAKELLDSLLEGLEVEPEELGDILTLGEGQYLDFKGGQITEKANRSVGRQVIREYVSGFANADGGILVVGVTEEKPRTIFPCQRLGETGLAEWAKDVVLDMAPFLVPLPRFQVVDHQEGPVLLIAVARAPQFVACTESRRAKYFLRIHDSTVEVPDFLAADLFLGRRQQPLIDLACQPSFVPSGPPHIAAKFYFSTVNAGLVAAEEVEVGFVCWGQNPPPISLNGNLRSHLEIREASIEWGLVHSVIRSPDGRQLRLTPFSRNEKPLESSGYAFPNRYAWSISAAAYVLARNAAPAWFEISFTFWAGPNTESTNYFQDVTCTRVVGRRPLVSAVRK